MGAGGTESDCNSPEKGPMGGVMFIWLFVLRVSQERTREEIANGRVLNFLPEQILTKRSYMEA